MWKGCRAKINTNSLVECLRRNPKPLNGKRIHGERKDINPSRYNWKCSYVGERTRQNRNSNFGAHPQYSFHPISPWPWHGWHVPHPASVQLVQFASVSVFDTNTSSLEERAIDHPYCTHNPRHHLLLGVLSIIITSPSSIIRSSIIYLI